PLFSATRPPVASLPVQRKTLIVDVEPPIVKSLTSRMSPSLCAPTNGCPPLVVTAAFSPMLFLKNQNPAVASPLLSKRSSPAYSSRWALLGSLYAAAYAWVMSSLGCGFDPVNSHLPL